MRRLRFSIGVRIYSIIGLSFCGLAGLAALQANNLADSLRQQRQGELLVKFTRWYTPGETLAMATGTNGELLAMSGERNPYPGKLGVIEQGALADLLLVDGDPLADIKLIEDPAKNLVVIMKDGKIYKNIL